MGREHRISVPAHRHLRIGTLNGIVGEIAQYLGIDKASVAEQLFG
jgi:hypothetical protein